MNFTIVHTAKGYEVRKRYSSNTPFQTVAAFATELEAVKYCNENY